MACLIILTAESNRIQQHRLQRMADEDSKCHRSSWLQGGQTGMAPVIVQIESGN